MVITPNYQLKEHNTLALSAIAAFYIEVPNEEQAKILPQDEYFRTIPFVIMGGGSNMLFVGDFKGAVLRYTESSITTLQETESTLLLKVGAGKNWHQLVLEVCEQGLWGIENLALIPGECGAAAVQNIGAYGREICEVLEAVHIIDLKDGSPRRLLASDCHYAYRHSIFKEEGHESWLVTAVELRLSKKPSPCLSYNGLKELQSSPTLTPTQVAERVIDIRNSKLPNPSTLPNAGSFFMNPVITAEAFAQLQSHYPHTPHYPAPNGIKVPAAWLIEQVGMKGCRQGTVGTYPQQPLVLINYGGAEAHQLIALAEEIQHKVQTQFGIELQPEVRYVRSGALYSLNQLS